MVLTPVYRQKGWEAPETFPEFLAVSIVFTLVVHAWETYLDYRQHMRLKERGTKVPGELKELVTDPELVKQLEDKGPASQAYGLEKSRFKFVRTTCALVLNLALTVLGAHAWAWDAAVGICERESIQTRFFPDGPVAVGGEIKVSLVYLGLWFLFETVTNTPFDYYGTFVVEAKHGFNKSTRQLFFVDKVKSILLTAVLGSPLIAGMLAIIRYVGPQHLTFYIGIFSFVMSLFFLTIFPVFIQPLFNKYEPLEDGELKTSIEDLARQVKYPLYKLFTVDGSKRSSHSNAYMYGFGKFKRIVLYDTLMAQASTTEIVAILAHELGHWKYGHTLLSFGVTQTYFMAAFFAFSKAMNFADMYRAFGFAATPGLSDTAGAPIIIGLSIFFATLWEPVEHTLSFLLTLNSRRMEYQADFFSTTLGYASALQRGLVKITFENLGILDPDPWYSVYHHSHPPLVHRLRAIDLNAKKTD